MRTAVGAFQRRLMVNSVGARPLLALISGTTMEFLSHSIVSFSCLDFMSLTTVHELKLFAAHDLRSV